jgi:hypothetical protein
MEILAGGLFVFMIYSMMDISQKADDLQEKLEEILNNLEDDNNR